MLREKAQERCDSDPKCVGLHWLNNAGAVRIDHGDWVNFGKDGRTVTTGMYQGCGGTLAATVNDDWDIIVKPGWKPESCVNVGPWQKYSWKPTNGWTRKGNAYHWAPGHYPNCEVGHFWKSGCGECEYALCPTGSVQTNKTTCPEGVTCKMPGLDAPNDWPSACPCIRSEAINQNTKPGRCNNFVHLYPRVYTIQPDGGDDAVCMCAHIHSLNGVMSQAKQHV